MARLTLEQFKKLAEEATYHLEVDGLCLTWLKQAAKDAGKDGQVVMKLLAIVEELLWKSGGGD